jgi:hypothetical protein
MSGKGAEAMIALAARLTHISFRTPLLAKGKTYAGLSRTSRRHEVHHQ